MHSASLADSKNFLVLPRHIAMAVPTLGDETEAARLQHFAICELTSVRRLMHRAWDSAVPFSGRLFVRYAAP